MKLWSIFLLALAPLFAAEQQSEAAIANAFYGQGEFRKAARHFELALANDPDNAPVHYRIGVAYEAMADTAAPFGRSYRSKARLHLTRASALAPGEPTYRRELFHFLLDSGGLSRSTLRQAADILRAVPQSDPEYAAMRREFELESRANGSAAVRLGRVILAVPETAGLIGGAPRSAWSFVSQSDAHAAAR